MRFRRQRLSVRDQLAGIAEDLARPCALLTPGEGPPEDATGSYVAGCPYLMDDRPWPTWLDQPMFFVAQVDLADLPPLDGFPTTGLLQWFVGSDDLSGLTFDETAGTVGFEVRWYADTKAPPLHHPLDPTPWDAARAEGADLGSPLEISEATVLRIEPGRMAPPYPELGDAAPDDLLVQLAAEVGEAAEDVELVWGEYVVGVSGPRPELGGHSNLGGYPSFTQVDPRGTGGYPPVDSPGGRLLLELDSNQFGGWGDSGVGHLFGDPAALGRGDVTGITYHWDCC